MEPNLLKMFCIQLRKFWITRMVTIKSEKELQAMRKANKIVAETHTYLKGLIKPGITTLELDAIAEDRIRSMGGIPAFKGYHGFPATLCTSINEEVVHGIPSKRILKEGDILSVDMGAIFDGYYGDSAVTRAVGKISSETQKLLDVTEKALYAGISAAVAGGKLNDIGAAVQACADAEGYGIVRDFVGHGIGQELHEDPQIPNYGKKGTGITLQEGMVLAIEPMINLGTYRVKILSDGWTAVTEDGSLSAHFEHTIAVRKGEPEILTAR